MTDAERPDRSRLKRFFDRLKPRFRRRPTEGKDPAFERAQAADERLVFSLARSRFPSFKQLRYLPEFINRKERRTILILSLVAAASLLALAGNFARQHLVSLPKTGGEYTEAMIGQPRFINPVLAGASSPDADLTGIVFSGLTKIDESGAFVPDLAERVEVSEDKKVYTATLRRNLKWHDGEDLTLDDVAFTYDIIKDAKFLSPLAGNFRNVTVEKVDDRTMRFTLKEASAMFPASLSIGILPQHLWNDVQTTNFALSEYNLRPVGSGPFLFSTLTKNSRTGEIKSYTLSRNPNYNGPKPYLDKLTFKFYPTADEAVTALKDGKVQGVSFLTHDQADPFRRERQFTVHPLSLAQTVSIFFSSRYPPFKSKEVRQALALGIDRERILKESVRGFGTIVDAPALPGLPGRRDGIKHLTFDPAAANDLLERNGWTRGNEGIRKKGNDVLLVTITTADEADYKSMASIVKEEWGALGVKVDIRTVDLTLIQKDVIRPRDYQSLLFAESLGLTHDLYPFWHSTQITSPGLNLSIFINKDVDQLLEDTRRSVPVERDAKFRRVQEILADEQPAVFLFQFDYPYVADRHLRGVATPLMVQSADRFALIEQWYLQTKLGWK